MRTLVAHIAIAGVEIPVPVVVELRTHDGLILRGAEPKVVVDGLRGRDGLADLTDGGTVAKAVAIHRLHFTDTTLLDEFESRVQTLVGAVLSAGLDDSAGLFNHSIHLGTGPYVPRDRLLHIHILAGLAGVDGVQGMPKVGAGQNHCVNILALQELAVVLDFLDLMFELAGHFIHVRGIGITDGNQLNSSDAMGLLGETAATATATDQGRANGIVGTLGLAVAESRSRQHGTTRGGEEATTRGVGRVRSVHGFTGLWLIEIL